MTSAIEVHTTALRGGLNGDEAYELARWLSADEDIMCGGNKCEIAKRLGYDWFKMPAADRYELAAACLIVASEWSRLTPFDRWLQRTYGTAKIKREFNARDLDMLRAGFEGGRDV